MFRTTLIALSTCGLLAACTGKIGGPPVQPAMTKAYSNSVGFTGVSTARGPSSIVPSF